MKNNNNNEVPFDRWMRQTNEQQEKGQIDKVYINCVDSSLIRLFPLWQHSSLKAKMLTDHLSLDT